ncbi:alpha/beta fold hydrolase [Ectopseudomonas khazarica]|uniref:alpha/beta fold hydrolase n=1 Tax=Ectopseudomonas khazarica TaxID=2502979 RepID=UPI001AEF961A|nr:alpha/beta hydrolase [Pseudomonas khazarica]QTS84308.1 alpha/beta fold hydrolase [Pseudomonas khazarica]
MNKPHLLLLPGLLCDYRLWRHQAEELAEIAHITHADLTQSDSVAELASQVLAQAPEQTFALVGHSLGGDVALEIMRRAPHRVFALALMDTSAHADSTLDAQARLELMRQAECDFPAVVTALLPRLLHPGHLQNKALVHEVMVMAEHLGSVTFIRQQRALLGRMDSRASLGQIACPTLLLCGLQDLIAPPALHLEMQQSIEGAQLAQIEESGHLTPMEQPHRVTSNLKDWLGTLQRPSPQMLRE